MILSVIDRSIIIFVKKLCDTVEMSGHKVVNSFVVDAERWIIFFVSMARLT